MGILALASGLRCGLHAGQRNEVKYMNSKQPTEIFRYEQGQLEPDYEIRAREIRRKMEYLRSLRLAGQAKQEAKRISGSNGYEQGINSRDAKKTPADL